MLLAPPEKEDFDFRDDIQVDVENKGFTEKEMADIAGEGAPGGKGAADWIGKLWGRNRKAPPEVENLKSEFGYQTRPVLTDLVAVAEAQKTPLRGDVQSLSKNYNFYMLRCGVYIAPEDGEKFEALKFEVRYKGEDVSTYALLPEPETATRLRVGATADIGINASAKFGFPEIPLQSVTVSAAAKAELEAKFIVAFKYELKSLVVDAFGEGTPFCKWLMHQGDKLRNTVFFYPVIMTPKDVTGFDCEFRAYFKISHPDWESAEFFLKPPRTVRVSA